jgi:hypothetical protein
METGLSVRAMLIVHCDGRTMTRILSGIALLSAVLLVMLVLGVTAQDGDFRVFPTSLEVSEPDGSASFSIKLTEAPTATVTIGISASNQECSALPSSIELTGENWNTGVSAEVTAVDDDQTDGDQPCIVLTGQASSADPNYNGKDPIDIEVMVHDDDLGIITVDPTTLSISEPSGSDSFNIRLSNQPTDDVTIGLSTSNNECSIEDSSVTLTSGNWQNGVDVVVFAVDDGIVDGEQACTVVTGQASSGDPVFNNKNPADVEVTVGDDDEPGIVVDPTELTVREPSGSDSFNIRLKSQPTWDVYIELSTSNDECYTSRSSVLLTSTNWRDGLDVTVTAVNDDYDDGSRTCAVVTAPASSGDGDYGGQDPADVSVTVQDDDTAGFLVDPTSLTVSEPDGSETFRIELTSRPTDNVTINMSTSNNECSIAPTTVTLTSSTWDDGAEVTVSAVDDEAGDGQQECIVLTAPAISDDNDYDNENPPDVTVQVLDDDSSGVSVYPTTVYVGEGSTTHSYQIVLTSQPTHLVTVSATTDGQTTVDPSELYFSTIDWSEAQTVTVTAVDDSQAEGEHSGTISHNVSSEDGSYNGQIPANVIAIITDNDTAGIMVSPSSLIVSEPNESAVFTFTLVTEPRDVVTILLSTSNGECHLPIELVTITSENWDSGAGRSVLAVDDEDFDGDQTCVVHTAAATSEDPIYNGRDPADVTVTVLDDEGPLTIYMPLIAHAWPPLPEVLELLPIDNADGDGSYTIQWTEIPEAEAYVLEEATDGDFSGAVEVYDGPSTSAEISGRGAARFFYRVKARSGSGESPWSNVQQVDVLWEAEPNDLAPSQANGPLVSGLTYYGTLPSGGDINDYFCFDQPEEGSVEAWLRNIPAGENYDLILRDADLNPAGYSGELGHVDEHILSGELPAGRYYIQVYHREGAGSDQEYHLQVVY